MSQSDTEVREHVRERYAAAARAVTASGDDALGLLDAANQCCGPATETAGVVAANASCCGSTDDVDASFGSALYSEDEQDELPAEALLASLGCGNPTAVADL
ncbi:MAG: hypothetical protein ABJA81_11285, partial [Nocardioidaceae bacterium]